MVKKFKYRFYIKNCLFGFLKLTKNTDPGKFRYSRHGIAFDPRSEFLFPHESMGKNVIIFGADMSSSVHIDNIGKDILILGDRPTQGSDDTALTAEALYWVYTITEATTSYLFMLQEYINSKQKTLK